MSQYGHVFGLREPYQVIGAYLHPLLFSMCTHAVQVDAQMIQDAERFTMDLLSSLERVLHGKDKLSGLFQTLLVHHCAQILMLHQ